MTSLKSNIIKRIKKSLNHVPVSWLYTQGPKKNIVVFASRRGGSTLLYQLLSVDNRTRIIYEPFVHHPGNIATAIKLNQLPRRLYDIYIELNKEEELQVYQYLNALMNGYYQEFNLRVNANRTVIKCINALSMADFFLENFDILPVYMTRHPIAQSLSVIRNNWHITNTAYLNSTLIKSKLSVKQIDFANRIESKGTYFQRCVLNWCLENFIPLYHSKLQENLRLTYEELVTRTDDMLEMLATTYQIENKNRMRKVLETVSRSSITTSSPHTQQKIRHREGSDLINYWMENIDQEEKKQCQEILNTFDFDIYTAFDTMPAKKYLRLS